ncbi:unnamed protein product, partial [Prorocentrum cordatum]
MAGSWRLGAAAAQARALKISRPPASVTRNWGQRRRGRNSLCTVPCSISSERASAGGRLCRPTAAPEFHRQATPAMPEQMGSGDRAASPNASPVRPDLEADLLRPG